MNSLWLECTTCCPASEEEMTQLPPQPPRTPPPPRIQDTYSVLDPLLVFSVHLKCCLVF